jgi:16S rRNA (guanine527-N7)-methyltransferase
MMQRLTDTARDLLKLSLSASQRQAFQTYANALMDWNSQTNLTAITEPDDIEIRHFVDSLICLKVIGRPRPGLQLVDVGTGAGFPGLPLKIVAPQIELTLVESIGKKVDFLRHVVDILKLDGVTLLNERAEDVGQDAAHREQYDWVLARAVASLDTLAEYLLPLARIGGHCLSQKGESAAQEASEAQAAIKTLGGKLIQLTAYHLPTVAETRYLVDIEKTASTPPKFPRRVGMPAKRPIN